MTRSKVAVGVVDGWHHMTVADLAVGLEGLEPSYHCDSHGISSKPSYKFEEKKRSKEGARGGERGSNPFCQSIMHSPLHNESRQPERRTAGR